MKHSLLRRPTSAVLLYAAVCLPPPGPVMVEPFPMHLPIAADEWSKELSLGVDSDVAVGAAASFTMATEVPYGSTLAIGPWNAGFRHAEYRYNKKFQSAAGTLRGVYRTENMMSYGTVVTASFYKSGKSLGSQDFYLDASTTWSYFQIPIRFSPPGTDTMSIGLGVAQKVWSRAFFSSLSFSREDGLPLKTCVEAPLLTRAPSPAPAAITPPGFFRLVNAGSAWWLVTPHGHYAYSTGVAARAGEDVNSTGAQFQLYKAMGFNSVSADSNIGSWISANTLRPFDTLWVFQTLNTPSWAERFSGAFDRLAAVKGEAAEHSFPDPYDPKFAAFYRASVRTVAQYVQNAPWFVGYYADTGLSFTDLPRRIWSPGAAQAFVSSLLVKYGIIGMLNNEWGTHFESFEELSAKKPDPETGNAAMKRDFALFTRELVKRYVLLTSTIIREEDANHLIFSNRFASGPELLEATPYLDLFSIYDGIAVDMPVENLHAGMTLAQRSQLEILNRLTGRPVMVAGTSLAARDSGEDGRAPLIDPTFWRSVPDQNARAAQAAHFLTDLYNVPFVIGAHWAGYQDGFAGGQVVNTGLLRRDGTLYPELTSALTKLNHQLYQAPQPLPEATGAAPVATAPAKPETGIWQTVRRIYPGRPAH